MKMACLPEGLDWGIFPGKALSFWGLGMFPGKAGGPAKLDK